MKTSDILSEILSAEGLTVQELATSINYPVNKLYDIKQGRTKKFSDELIGLISDRYPNYTRAFLLTGENVLLADRENGNGIPKTNEVPIFATVTRNIDKILSELSAQREMSDRHMTEAFEIIKHFQQQTDRMIALMEQQRVNTII